MRWPSQEDTIGVLIRAALLALTFHQGVVAYYSPGVMERVADNRGMERVDCMIASPWHQLGEWVVLSVSDGSTLLCRVTDVSHPRDYLRHLTRGLIEVDYRSYGWLCGTYNRRPEDCKAWIYDLAPP